MSIVTKKGDRGKTHLYQGPRVSKDHIRIESCGTLDELSSYLGLSKSMIKNKQIKKIIEKIQKDLFILCAEIATEAKSLNKLKERIDNSFVECLDGIIKGLEDKKSLRVRYFQVSGENPVSSTLDICRTIARRAERRVITLKRKKFLSNRHILIYLNRLSDFLYLLARKFATCKNKNSA
ncbi:MAG: cob(I)yrinic acid a,c-diamide adenosyltransferase [Candidatus Omnitrophica bacterium]|nr:cob(I)yrinic acid a,c-diamide adenosyltransferase [Candidatus Omnitrophota bacterium]